ncbi:MAG TPA: PQQ-binding-like beta-propeller repeat protein [Planctomycetota bacterium]
MNTLFVALALLQVPKPVDGPPPGKLTLARRLVVLLEDKGCARAVELVKAEDVDVYVQLADAGDVAAAAEGAGAYYGTRITVGRGTSARVGLADNLADRIVAPAGTPRAEVLRVLSPLGRARIGDEEFGKPAPAGADDWTHPYHGPDNNPQTRDTLARAPFLTQFLVEPRYGSCPQTSVAAGGRLFTAFGHVAWHRREEHTLNTLMAFSVFNGAVLWKKPIKPGLMVDRSTMIATPELLYVADDASCKILDAATGEPRGEIKIDADGTFWKWMAMENGLLYALVGAAEPLDPVAKWGRVEHGWPWNGISKGYNEKDYAWGYAKTLFAIDPATRKVVWSASEDELIDARAICLKNGRVFVSNFGKYLAALDAKTGKEIWRKTAAKDPALFEAIGAYRPGHGYIEGWKSTVYVKAGDEALYFAGPQTSWLSAVAIKDGGLLWKRQVKNLQILLRDGSLFVIGAQRTSGETKRLDPMTGDVLQSYDVSRRACTRVTGTPDGVVFRGYEGTTRLDVSSGKPQWINVMRPSCQVGVITASGHLLWIPWGCDCSLQMFGVMGLGPAGDFAFDQKAVESERLETFAEAGPAPAAAADWPTYRGDNRRSAKTAAEIPAAVKKLWEFAPPTEVEVTAPVMADGLAFTAGVDGLVRGIDAATGAVKWTSRVGGAVRYPPSIADGRVFVGSGDGAAYALEAATGKTLWRFRAAPIERRIPVLGALLSTWPVGSGVLVDGPTAYFAAGMNCMDGTYVFAVEAATGKIRWQNTTSGHLDAFSKTGVAAQGELLLNGGKLYLAGGNAASPGVYDVKDGTCLTPAPEGQQVKSKRGRELTLGADGDVLVSGQPLYSAPDFPVFDRAVIWGPMVVTAANGRLTLEESKERGWVLRALPPGEGAPLWEQTLPSMPQRWGLAIDAAGRIVVTLRSGRVLCFGR